MICHKFHFPLSPITHAYTKQMLQIYTYSIYTYVLSVKLSVMMHLKMITTVKDIWL